LLEDKFVPSVETCLTDAAFGSCIPQDNKLEQVDHIEGETNSDGFSDADAYMAELERKETKMYIKFFEQFFNSYIQRVECMCYHLSM
jgi:hypothetical protein